MRVKNFITGGKIVSGSGVLEEEINAWLADQELSVEEVIVRQTAFNYQNGGSVEGTIITSIWYDEE